MSHDQLEAEIREAILGSKLLRIERADPMLGDLRGFPLRLEGGLLLLRLCEDFSVGGWVVSPIAHITGQKHDAVEHFDRGVLQADDLLEEALSVPELDMGSLAAVAGSFRGKQQLVGVLAEKDHPDEYIVGRVKEAYSTALLILETDRLGGWDEDTTSVPLSSITQFHFGGDYLEIQNRHLQPEPDLKRRPSEESPWHDAPLTLVETGQAVSATDPEIRTQLLSYCESGEYCRLERSFPGTLNHVGHVLAVGEETVALERFHDFYSEGASLIRIESITQVSTDVQDRWMERTIATEGARRVLPPSEALESFTALLTWAQAQDVLVIIELEKDGEADDEFYLGRVLSVDHEQLSVIEMDTEGVWIDETCHIDMESVTRVEVSSLYTELYKKHGAAFPVL